MNASEGYEVFFFPQALDALGEAIKPYLIDGPAGTHVLCTEIDTGGALLEMTIAGTTPDGKPMQLELMVPTSMVRMIVSAHSDGSFGFGPRAASALITALPPVAASAPAADAPPEALPHTASTADDTPAGAPPKP